MTVLAAALAGAAALSVLASRAGFSRIRPCGCGLRCWRSSVARSSSEVELADPGPGEVLVRLVACGVCHTDLYTASGVDPSGYAPTVLGHEGAGVVERIGEGVSSLALGDHVVTLFSPQCRWRGALRQPADEPVPRDPRAAESRPPARRHDAPFARWRADAPLHGHLDLRAVHGHARDRARADRPRGAGRRVPLRLRLLHGPGRGDAHGGGAPRFDVRCASCSGPGWSGWGRSPAAGWRARSGSSRSTSRRRGSSSRGGRARPTRSRAGQTRSSRSSR